MRKTANKFQGDGGTRTSWAGALRSAPQVFGTSATDIVKFDTLLFRAGHNPPMRQLLSRPRNADGVGAPIWKAAAAAVYQIPNTEHMAYRLVRNGFLIIHDGVNNCHSRCLHRLSISFVRLSIFVQRVSPRPSLPAPAPSVPPSASPALKSFKVWMPPRTRYT